MKHLTLAIALLTSAGLAQAATHEHGMHHDMSGHDMSSHPMSSGTMPATHQGMGVVKAINEKSGKVQIAHEPIAALEWPAMTMWFGLETPLPEGLKAGDKVRFVMKQGDNKEWVIVTIARP